MDDNPKVWRFAITDKVTNSHQIAMYVSIYALEEQVKSGEVLMNLGQIPRGVADDIFNNIWFGVLEDDTDRYDIGEMFPFSWSTPTKMHWGIKNVTLLEK